MAKSNEECEPIIPGKITPKKLPKQGGGGGHEFVTELPETGEDGVEYVLMNDISDCGTYVGTYVYNPECEGWIPTSGSGGGAVERYSFETTDTGWRALRNNKVIFSYVDKDTIDSYEETATGFQIIRNGSVIFTHDDKVTDVPVYTAENTTTGWVLKKDGTTIFTYVDKNNEYIIEDTDDGWVFKENGVIKYTYVEPADTPSDGTYFVSGGLTEVIGGTTTVAATAVTGLVLADVVIGETLIYDKAGTVGRVTAVTGTDLTVETITTSPGERRGTRLGAVDDQPDLPATVTAAEAMGWQTPLAGDFAYIREDSTHDDHLTEWVIQGIDGSGNITWAYSHTLNAGNYVLDIYKYGDYPSGSPIPKNPDGSVTLPKDEDHQYDFETVTDSTGKITGWKVKDHETGTTLYTYTDQNDDTNTEYEFEDTKDSDGNVNGWRVKDKATGVVLFTHVDVGDTTYNFEAVTVSGKITGWRVKDGKTGTVLFTYNDLNDLSDGAYFTSETLDDGITNTTSVGVSTVSGLSVSDVVDGETLIYDADGTLGVVTAHTATALTVTTMTTAGGSGTTYTFKNTTEGWQATNDKTGTTFYHADMNALVDGEHMYNRGKVYFVDADNGDDANDGSLEHPFRTLQQAVNQAAPYYFYMPEYPFRSHGGTTIYVNTSATKAYEPVYFSGKRCVIHSYNPATSTGSTIPTGLDIDDKTATLKIVATAYARDDLPGAYIYPGCWNVQYSFVNVYIANLNFTQSADTPATCVYIGLYSVFDWGNDVDQNSGMKYTMTINANVTGTKHEYVYNAATDTYALTDTANVGCEGIGVHQHSRFVMRGTVPSGSQLNVYSSNWGVACSDHSYVLIRPKATVYGGYNVNNNCGAAYANANSTVIFESTGATTSNLGQLNFESIASNGTTTVIHADHNSTFLCQNFNQNLYIRKRATNTQSSNAVFANHGSTMVLLAYNNFQVINQQVQSRAICAGRGGVIRIGTAVASGTYNIFGSNTGSPTAAGEAIEAYEQARVCVLGGTGTTLPNIKGRVGYAAWNGGQISYANIGKFTAVGSSTSQRSVSAGGRIYTGGQSSMGSY